jgi:hypothetical protein
MLPDVYYRGYRIVWDTRQPSGIAFWTGKAAVVMPPDACGVKRIQRVGGNGYFLSESEVRDHLLSEAKQWIDNEIDGYDSPLRSRPHGIERHHATNQHNP